MFNLFKKKIKPTPGLKIGTLLKTDMHSHLIPGIDDGAPDVETSLSLIKGLMDLGYTKLITTPHIMSDYYQNTPEIIREQFEVLKQAVEKEGLDIELRYAAEYYVDEFFEERLEKEELLPISGKKVLIEQSFSEEYPRLRDVTFRMQLKGYKPVLAHAERYPYYASDTSKYESLIDAGCILQVNILSLQGYYGKLEKKAANYLIKNNLAELLGTDCHHERHLNRIGNFFDETEISLEGIEFMNSKLAG